MVSAGGLLEWLLAVRRATAAASATADRPTRLYRLTCYDLRLAPGAPLRCRARSDGASFVTSGARGVERLLLATRSDAEQVARPSTPTITAGERLDAQAFYAELAARSLDVDPQHRAVTEARFGEAGAIAAVDLAGDAEHGFILGPRALDAAIHVAFAQARRQSDGLEGEGLRPMPVIGALSVFAASGTTRRICVSNRGVVTNGFDIWLEAEDGTALAHFEGVVFHDARTLHAQLSEELTEIFETIARQCLPAASIDRDTSLVTLGASSIDLIRIGTLANDALGWTPPLAELVRTPTLARLVDLYLHRDAREHLATSTQALSATERQLWFLERMTNAAGSYNEGFAWRIRGALSIEALERALVVVQRRHPALRSYFPSNAGAPERRLDWRQCQLELVETPAVVRSSPELLERLVAEQVCRPFDLEHAPPFRCVLLLHAAGDATLVLAAHHVICDAWALARVLVPELQATYLAFLDTPGDQLEPMTQLLESEHREPDADYVRRAEAHFRELLAGVPGVLDFPFDHSRPVVQTHRGGCVHRPLTAVRWQGLKALARQLGHSPFVIGLAAQQILLQRYTRMDDFCVGVPLSLRRDADDARRLGCLVNLSVLRARVDSSLRFDAHCARVKEALIETLRFDQLALGDIVRVVAPARSLSHTPLVQAVFAYRELAGTSFELPGATTTPIFVHNRRAKFDLTLSLDDYGEDAELSLEYASDLLDRQSATRLLDHYESLLDAIVSDPRVPLASLQLPSASERARIVSFEHGPERPAPHTLDLRAIWEREGDAPVLRTASRSVTKLALREHVLHIRAALRDANVQPGELVAVCVPRSASWVAAVLAILELGAAYVPLDPRQPAVRVRHGVSRAGARVVISLDGAFEPEPGAGLRIIELRTLPHRLPEDDRPAAVTPEPQQPVYAIMTSGSTGLPRVAVVAHAGFANLVAAYAELLSLTPADRILLATSIGFDLTQKNVFAALRVGAELIIDEADDFDPDRLVGLIDACAITLLNCTPSLAYALVASAAATDLRKLRSLRMLVLGGEPIDWRPLQPWLEHPSCSVRVLNSYGPTECSDVVTTAELTAADSGSNLGRPIANARCRVVDAVGALAGIGVPGELHLAGTPVGLGYAGDPAATAARFIDAQVPPTRWYRTGDLARWTERGDLQYLGRVDTQVKIRGYRIELAEIDAALAREPNVAEAVVVCRDDHRGRPMLVGYVIPASAQPIDTNALRRSIGRNLPSYMVPQAIVAIERAPRTSSGKLDRKALQALPWRYEPDATSAATSEPDPDSGVLASVRAAFCDVLGLPTVAADASFFDVGGHSLAAIELVARVDDDFGLKLPAAAIFERPVLRDFAALVTERRALADSVGQPEPVLPNAPPAD